MITIAAGEPLFRVPPARSTKALARGIEAAGRDAARLGSREPVGARGQMMMQELLVNRGGELPDPELRSSMMTLAGTEPSTLFGMTEVLGVDSPDAKSLQQQLVIRMSILADPEQVLPNNPVLRDSIRTTDQIAAQLINENTGAVTAAVEDRAADRRTETRRSRNATK